MCFPMGKIHDIREELLADIGQDTLKITLFSLATF